MKSNEIEFLSEVADIVTETCFGSERWEQKDGDFVYTEKAQDFFNSKYDEIEDLYIKLIKK